MKQFKPRFGRSARSALLCLFAGGALLGLLSACSEDEGPDAKTKAQLVEVASTPYSFAVALPQGSVSALLSASNRLTINGNGTVGLSGTISTVAGFGSGGQTNIQAGSKIYANLLSTAPIMLNSQSTIYGFAQSSGAIQLQDSTPQILGGQMPNTPVVPQSLSFTVDWPDQPGTDVVRYAANGSLPPTGNPGEILPPGNYGKLELHDRNRVTLTAGKYFFTSFTLQPQAEIRIDSTAGPVQIYVNDGVNNQGTILPAVNASGTPTVKEGEVLLATRGAGQVNIVGSFRGTIIAPNAEIRLSAPNNGGQHKGSFYGKDVTVDSNSNLPVIPLDVDLDDILDDPDDPGDPGDPEGPCADADVDGVCNEDDECDADPEKSERGLCDCGEADTNTDDDLVPDCDDDEPDDPDVTVTGGCAELPPGAPCENSRVGGEPATCNSDGTCGSPDPGRPGGDDDGADCFDVARRVDGVVHHYWFCPGPVDWQTAQNRCLEVPGRSLVRPSSVTDDNWLQAVAGFDAWIGVRRTGDDWYHVVENNLAARKIREGGVDGFRVGGAFQDWAEDEPQGGRCAALTEAGEWIAASCGTPEGFICDLPISGGYEDPDDEDDELDDDEGDVLSCVESPFSVELGLDEAPTPEQLAAIEAEVAACNACTGPCAACPGALAFPTGNTCAAPDVENDRPMNCRFSDDFNNFPPPLETLTLCDPEGDWRSVCDNNPNGEFCGRLNVLPPVGEGDEPRNFYVCGPVDPYCAANVPEPDPAKPCGEEQICNPDLVESVIDEETFLDESSLDEVTENDIVDLFPEPPVLPEDVAIPGFETPGCGTAGEGGKCTFGLDHPWCNPYENAVEASETIGMGAGPTVNPLENTAGNTDSGGDSGRPIQFDFDPDLNLNYQVGPGLYGDFDLALEASVSLLASAHIDSFLVISDRDIDILDAKAGGSVNRCSGGLEAHLKLLGHDFLPDLIQDEAARETFENLIGIREFGEECEEIQQEYLGALGRAKKAYRDAQEVIRQYKQGIENNQRFGDNFCSQLIQAQPPEGFPFIDCANTEPQHVVNAFIEYARYVLQNELAGLSPFPSAELLKDSVSFPSIGDRESTTLASMNFAIGPIPMNLSIDAFFGYGMTGEASYGLNPAGVTAVLGDPSVGAETIAFATANATPYADAGIEIFLGAGFDFGPVAAKLGISGEVTVADVSIPATAGAEILMEGIPDDRLLDEETEGMIQDGAAPFFPASGYTAYRFYSGFHLDITAEVDRILSGSLNAKLKIKFLFFSKSWQKQIAAFKGFSLPPIPLANASFDGVELGVIRMPFTFPALARFTEPPPEPVEDDGMGGAPPEITDFSFDKGRVVEFFHKELCAEPVIKECPQIFETQGVFLTQLEGSDRLVAYGSAGADLHDRVKLFSSASELDGDIAVRYGPLLLRNDVSLNNVYGGDPLTLWHRVSYNNLLGQSPPLSLLPIPAIILESPPVPNYSQSGPLYVYWGQTVELAAGSRYSNVVVYQGGTLILNGEALAADTPQEFFFDNLTVHPGGVLRVNHAEGAVEVAIANSFTWRGTLENGTGRANAHVFGVYGQQDVYMQSENGFQGTVVVPNATLELNSRNYVGAYYGEYLEVHQDANLTFYPCEGL